jgi:UDP-2,3-diacylglucosamine hydrolase
VADQPKDVFFISDAHLGSGPNLDMRRDSLVELIASLGARASHLYLLGDLFDFWFEYRHAVPKGHFQILRALAALVASGVRIDYFGGNHDFWCGSYLEQEVGLVVHQQPAVVSHQGRRIFLAHGDGIASGDRGYKFLKALLRHPWAVALYRTVHPDLGIPIAYRVSKLSRTHSLPFEVLLARYAHHLVGPRFAAGDDAVVIGHVHTPIHLRDPQGRDFLILGDWLENFTYIRLAQGVFHLERKAPGEIPERIEPAPWPPLNP